MTDGSEQVEAPTTPPPAAGARVRRRIRRDPTRARASAPGRARIWRERAPLPLALCVIVAPELLGGVFGWAISITALLAALACITVWIAYRRELAAIPAPVPLVLAFGVLGWTAFQALPLPFPLAEWLAPRSAEAVRLTAHAAGTAVPALCAVTRDPGGTAAEIVKGAAIVAALAAAWALTNLGRREVIVRMAAASVILIAVVAAAHLALREHAVFGLYTPPNAASIVPAPLMNENQLGAFLAMGVPLMLLLGAEARIPATRLGWFAAAASCATLTLFTMSRGATGSLVIGVAVLTALLTVIRARAKGSSHRPTVPWLGLIAAVGAVAIAYGASDAIVATFRDRDLGKLRVAAASLRLALETPVLGVGRGAFSAAFVRQDGPDGRFVFPENLPAQWLVEWGFPVALALGGTIVARLVRAVSTTRSVVRGAAVASVVGIAAHDLVDFSLERVGIAVVASIVLAAALAPDHEREGVPADGGRWWPSVGTLLLAATVTAALAGTALAPRIVGTSVLELQESLEHASARHDTVGFQRILGRAIALHPAEPAFALLAGADAARSDRPVAARWLTRAMQLAPNWTSPHAIAAVWLWRTGRTSQAVLEVRETAERSPAAARALGCELAHATHDARVVLRAAPRGDGRVVFLDGVASCLPTEQAAIVDADLLTRFPHLSTALERQAQRDLDGGRPQLAVVAMRRVVARSPEDTAAQTLLASALVAEHHPEEAADVLEIGARLARDPRPLLTEEARVRASAGDATGMRRTVEELRGLAASSSQDLAATMMLLGDLEESLGNDAHALHAYEEARRFDAHSGSLARVAAISTRLGDMRGAFRAYAQMCDDDGPASPACVQRDRLARPTTEPDSVPGQPTADGPIGPPARP